MPTIWVYDILAAVAGLKLITFEPSRKRLVTCVFWLEILLAFLSVASMLHHNKKYRDQRLLDPKTNKLLTYVIIIY